MSKLRQWRDRFEVILDQRHQRQDLEQWAPYLSEFQYQKFDEVEIPGQYLQVRLFKINILFMRQQLKDNNNDFIRIDRVKPTLDIVRGHGVCYRRLSLLGHDGNTYAFAVQYPAARHCRREERITQLFRLLNE